MYVSSLPERRITGVIRPSDRRRIGIMYTDSKAALENILKWLEGAEEAGWEGQIESGEAAREDMERMARPDYHRGHGRDVVQGTQRDPNAPKLNRAIPHVRAMLTAMQNRNRVAALEHVRLALAVM